MDLPWGCLARVKSCLRAHSMSPTEKTSKFRLVHGQATIKIKRKIFEGKILAVDYGRLIVENDAPLTINKLVQLSLRLFDQPLSIYAFPLSLETKGSRQYAQFKIHGLSGDPLAIWNRWVQFAKANPLVGSPAIRDPLTPNV